MCGCTERPSCRVPAAAVPAAAADTLALTWQSVHVCGLECECVGSAQHLPLQPQLLSRVGKGRHPSLRRARNLLRLRLVRAQPRQLNGHVLRRVDLHVVHARPQRELHQPALRGRGRHQHDHSAR
eukprot:scaffold12204_cov61-Phaeocystis_antarctica.AAC.9